MDDLEIKERRKSKAYLICLEELNLFRTELIKHQTKSQMNRQEAVNLKDLAHRIKGSMGFFGFSKLEILAGKLESQLLNYIENNNKLNTESLIKDAIEELNRLLSEEANA
ncbi:MAG: Hpt domain-containing protein [Bdellovibrionota bacterium]